MRCQLLRRHCCLLRGAVWLPIFRASLSRLRPQQQQRRRVQSQVLVRSALHRAFLLHQACQAMDLCCTALVSAGRACGFGSPRGARRGRIACIVICAHRARLQPGEGDDERRRRWSLLRIAIRPQALLPTRRSQLDRRRNLRRRAISFRLWAALGSARRPGLRRLASSDGRPPCARGDLQLQVPQPACNSIALIALLARLSS